MPDLPGTKAVHSRAGDTHHTAGPKPPNETEARFVDHARMLAGWAGLVLKWPPSWFWDATPEELAGVVEAGRGPDAATIAPMDTTGLSNMRVMFPDG